MTIQPAMEIEQRLSSPAVQTPSIPGSMTSVRSPPRPGRAHAGRTAADDQHVHVGATGVARRLEHDLSPRLNSWGGRDLAGAVARGRRGRGGQTIAGHVRPFAVALASPAPTKTPAVLKKLRRSTGWVLMVNLPSSVNTAGKPARYAMCRNGQTHLSPPSFPFSSPTSTATSPGFPSPAVLHRGPN